MGAQDRMPLSGMDSETASIRSLDGRVVHTLNTENHPSLFNQTQTVHASINEQISGAVANSISSSCCLTLRAGCQVVLVKTVQASATL